MKVYFLRHGIAADAETWGGDDASRPLTNEGRDRMEREAKAIAKLDLGIDVIVTSPLVRARQTAEIVADRLDMRKKLVGDSRLANSFSAAQLAAILQDQKGAETIMLVGHEPDMSATVGRLVGAARIDLKKGGLACVDLPDRSSMQGDLVWLVPPKVLTL